MKRNWAEKELKAFEVEYEKEKGFGNLFWVDFYIPKFKLVLEINENHHQTEKGKLRDLKVFEYLLSKGIELITIEVSHKNREEGRKKISEVVEKEIGYPYVDEYFVI